MRLAHGIVPSNDFPWHVDTRAQSAPGMLNNILLSNIIVQYIILYNIILFIVRQKKYCPFIYCKKDDNILYISFCDQRLISYDRNSKIY